MTANTHTELVVALNERSGWRELVDPGTRDYLAEAATTIESLSSKLEAAREALRKVAGELQLTRMHMLSRDRLYEKLGEIADTILEGDA